MTHRSLRTIPWLQALLLALLLTVPAQAGIVTSPDEFSGSEVLIDFEGVAVDDFIVNQYPGVTFELVTGEAPQVWADGAGRLFAPFGTNAIINRSSFGSPFPNMEMTFDTPINRVAFEIRNNNADDLNLIITCISSGHVVGSSTYLTDLGFRVFGVESAEPFDKVIVDVTANDNGIFSMDNIRYEMDLTDTDLDGVIDIGDNCPEISNSTQADSDGDGRGDACFDPVLIDNGLDMNDVPPNTFFSFSYSNPTTGVQFEVADDFTTASLFSSSERWIVSGVSWAGGILDSAAGFTLQPIVGDEQVFDIFIIPHSFASNGPVGNPIESIPPSAASGSWQVTVKAEEGHSLFGAFASRYSATLDPPFIGEPNTHYWMVIAARGDFAYNEGVTDGTGWAWLGRGGTGNAHQGGTNFTSTWINQGRQQTMTLYGTVNTPPVCDAGGPYTGQCGDPAFTRVLDGTGSVDANGTPLAYDWNVTCNSAAGVSLINGATATPILDLDPSCNATSCDVNLSVSDGFFTTACQTSFQVQPKDGLDDVAFVSPDPFLQVLPDTLTNLILPVGNGSICPVGISGIGTSGFQGLGVTGPSALPGLNSLSGLCEGTTDLTITVDSSGAVPGSESDGIVFLQGTGPGSPQLSTNVRVRVLGALESNLSVQPPDGALSISPVGLNDFDPFSVTARVRNTGLAGAGDFAVEFFANTAISGQISRQSLGTVPGTPGLSAGDFEDIGLAVPGGLQQGSYVLEAVIHAPGEVEAGTVSDNVTSIIFGVGSGPQLGNAAIVVTASGNSGCNLDDLVVQGSAKYVIPVPDPTPGGPEQATYPVQGGLVTLIVRDALSGSPVGAGSTTHTDVNGNYRYRILSPGPGDYTLDVSVTDQTLTGATADSTTILATTDPACSSPGGCTPGVDCPTPPPGPTPSPDLSFCPADLNDDYFQVTPVAPGLCSSLDTSGLCYEIVVDSEMVSNWVAPQGIPVEFSFSVASSWPNGAGDSDRLPVTDDVFLYGGPGQASSTKTVFYSPPARTSSGVLLVEAGDDQVGTGNDVATEGLDAFSTDPTTEIKVRTHASGCADIFRIEGRSSYIGQTLNVGCGTVTAEIVDHLGVTHFAGPARVNSHGRFVLFPGFTAPPTFETYQITVTVSDGVYEGTRSFDFTCGPGVPAGGGSTPTSTGVPPADMSIFSEDIAFLGDPTCSVGLSGVPDPGAAIGVQALFHYGGPVAPADGTVSLFLLSPQIVDPNGQMVPNAVGSSQTVTFPGNSGNQAACFPWTTPTLRTTYVVQARVEPDPNVNQDATNDRATRAITVGNPLCDLDLTGESILYLHPGETGQNIIDVSHSSELPSAPELTLEFQGLPGADLASLGIGSTFAPETASSWFTSDLTVTTQHTTPTGYYPVLVTARGNACSAIDSFTLAVVNAAPVITSVSPDPNVTMDAGTTLEVLIAFTDPDPQDDVTVSVDPGSLPFPATVMDNGNGTATLTLEPGIGDVGSYGPIIVTISDPHGGSDAVEIAVEVEASCVGNPATGDSDGDGYCDDTDNCPIIVNADQTDGDGDGAGDACDVCPGDPADDSDGDGICNGTGFLSPATGDGDNCPATANADQEDTDGDGAGDACDICPGDPDDDADGDGICAETGFNAPAGGDQDNCPADVNSDQADNDGDGIGDVCDPDDDNDGVLDATDNCPLDANAGQLDNDGDGVGDACDPDPIILSVVNNGPVNEGSSVTVTVTAAPPQKFGGSLSYSFDCDADGIFETLAGAVNSASCLFDDEEATGLFAVNALVTSDATGGFDTAQNIVTVLGVAPDVGTILAPMEPVALGLAVDANAPFTDASPVDTHTASWDWGDGTGSAGTVVESGGSGTAGGSHLYTTPGVYTVTLTVTDDEGLSGEEIYQFVVVYDPDGGFVTGGGFIDSLEGSFVADPGLTGKATFGFVSKYKKGATVPTGNTAFRFQAAGMSFKSVDYEWLVVSGHTAKFKGTGTINGSGDYGFMLFAVDEKLTPSVNEDQFRIKIWDRSNGDAVVYDNEIGVSELEDATTPIGGGSIVIHKK